LESNVHNFVLSTSIGRYIFNHTLLYALYGGFMAALFEETGRLIAMRTSLVKDSKDAHNAILYGAGHGGFEAFYILTISMINNIIFSSMINSGQMDAVLASLNDILRPQIEAIVLQLINNSPPLFLVSVVERISAITAHIGMSVIVWYAAVSEKINWKYYFIAFGCHMALDTLSVLINKSGSILLTEIFIAAMAIGIVILARKIWIKEHKKLEDAPVEESVAE